MNEELEPEVLSYREFKNRETLLAWERRRRAHESRPFGGGGERPANGFMPPATGVGAPAPR